MPGTARPEASGRVGGFAALTLVGLAVVGLCGCAAGGPGVGSAGEREIRTASDQTDSERRARIRLELAGAYFARGQFETALDEIKQAMAINASLADGHNLRGLVYASLEQPRMAEDSFRRALQIDGRNPDTLHNYGWFLCQLGRLPEADQQFATALAQPQYRAAARTWLARGVCEARAGRLDAAESSLTRAYEREPANATIALNYAEVLHRRGQTERAAFYVRRVNEVPEQVDAQSLWLALRVERKLGNQTAARVLERQLRERFPQSTEVAALQAGRFDD